MKKKVLAVFLAAAVSCTMGAPAYGAEFSSPEESADVFSAGNETGNEDEEVTSLEEEESENEETLVSNEEELLTGTTDDDGNRAQRQRGDVFHHGKAQIGGDAERRKVRTHQPRDVGEHGDDGERHRQPAISGHMDGIFIPRRDLDDLPQDAPDVPKRYQRQQRARGGQRPRKVGQNSVRPGIIEQPG